MTSLGVKVEDEEGGVCPTVWDAVSCQEERSE